jgi:release factor glutamine methyltransferase
MIDLLGQLSASGKLGSGNLISSQNSRKTLKIADVGAGSGALGITAKLEFPTGQNVTVDLLEIDPAALKIAKINVDKLTTSVQVIQSDLLANSTQDYDILLCNLPYVPDSHSLNQAALQEPKIAIFGGPEGLDLYRKLFDQLITLKKQPLYILTESLPPQHDSLAALAHRAGYELEQTEDFIQVFTKA